MRCNLSNVDLFHFSEKILIELKRILMARAFVSDVMME